MMARLPSASRTDRQMLCWLVAIVAVSYVVVVTASMGHVSYDVWAPLWIIPLLAGGSFVLIGRLSPCDTAGSLVPLLRTALLARAAGSVVR